MALLLALPLFALAACGPASGNPAPWAYQNEQRTQLAGWSENGQAQPARMSQSWPVFSGKSRPEQAVNKFLRKMREQRLGEFSSAAYQYLAALTFNGQTLEDKIYVTQEESAAVFYSGGPILSIVVDGNRYFSGEPHFLAFRCAYNFDAQSGAMLTLEDIWGEQAHEQAAAEIYAQIERGGQLDGYAAGLEGLLLQKLKPDHWYMDAHNIYIIYDPYDIAPYAAGIVEFTLPQKRQ